MDERDTRKLVSATNVMLLIAFALFLACIYLTLYLTKTFGPFSALTTLTISTILQELIALIIPVVVFIRYKRFNFSKYLRIKPAKLGMSIRIFFLAVSGYLFITCFIVLWNIVFGTQFSYKPGLENYISNDFIGTMGMVVNVAVFAAIGEEILFRGMLLRGLQPLGNFKAVILTAFAFAVFHLSFARLGYTFMLGIIMGYITIATGNIMYSILYHLLHNTISIFIDITYLVQNALSATEKTNYILAYVAIMLFSASIMYVIYISIKDQTKAQRESEQQRLAELEEKLIIQNRVKSETEEYILEDDTENSEDCLIETEVNPKIEMKNYERTELLSLRNEFDDGEYLTPVRIRTNLTNLSGYIVFVIVATCIIIATVMGYSPFQY